GFVVLQMEDSAAAFTDDTREGKLYAEGTKAGIDYVVSRDIVDASKVGYIGWSRTGFHELYVLAEYPRLLRAVSICDSVQAGYFQTFMLNVNSPQDLSYEMTRMSGGTLPQADLAGWFARNPLYKLSSVRAAVRIEADTGGVDNAGASVLNLWETYAVLRSAGRPVDFVYFPRGSHNQTMPAERLGSQGGNIDWFRFWLQGYEDRDPAK